MQRYDVAIAGCGLIGASIALELAEKGLSVAVFDAGEPGREASWASAGIISPAPENPGSIPLVSLGKASAALYPEFAQRVEEISEQEVHYRASGSLDVILKNDAPEELSTMIAVHHGLGLKAKALGDAQVREMEPALTHRVRAAILRPEEASVDNRKLTQATIEAARRRGAAIFPGEAVLGVWKETGACRGLALARDRVEAKWTIIAAGCFSARIEGVAAYAPVSPVKGQMLRLQSEKIRIEHVIWSEHAYLVPRTEGRVLVGATIERVGFDTTVTAGAVKKLLDAAIELVPEFEKAGLEETWTGLRPDSPDHLPILGPCDVQGLLFATGHFRSGILLAPITAKLMGEWITKQTVSEDWERFRPMRFVEAKQAKANL